VAYKPISRQRPLLGSDPCATMEIVLAIGFSMWSAKRLHHATDRVQFSHVWVGLNTSIVALQVVGDDKKGILESGRVKYGRESHGTRIRE
jgi:hypothetical protein